MSNIEWLEQPYLRDPIALIAFEGWNDASDAASGALEYLIDQAGVSPFASIDMEGFINYQISRPHVSIEPEGRMIHWPTTGFFGVTLSGNSRDAVLILGEEPQLRWQQFTRDIVEVLRGLGVTKVITLGAFIGQVPHTLPIPLFGDSAEPGLTERLGIMQSNYEGPTGIIGVLHAALRDGGFDATTMWAAIPHYLSANPSPKASLALLERVAEAIGHHFDLGELRSEVEDYELQVAEAVDESTEFVEYVRELEESADTPRIDAQGGDQLVEEIERYLRDSD
jgi:proteasome assembly chaperone (PAC2) family protein